MIAGVDHVALTCSGVDAAVQALRRAGFEHRFTHCGAPNREEKAHLLGDYEPLHSVAFCPAVHGTALELTDHGAAGEAEAPFQLLLRRQPPGWLPGETPYGGYAETWAAALGCGSAAPGRWKDLACSVWVAGEQEGPQAVAGVIVPCARLDLDEPFWTRGLGIRVAARGTAAAGAWARLEIAAAMPQWRLNLVLAGGRRNADALPMLDDRGFPCIAFLSTAIETDLDRLLEHGGSDTTGVFNVGIHERELQVALARAPSGGLVELIQVGRTPGRPRV